MVEINHPFQMNEMFTRYHLNPEVKIEFIPIFQSVESLALYSDRQRTYFGS